MAKEFKGKRPHVLVLNDVAWKIVESCRGVDGEFVFVWRRERVKNVDVEPLMPYRPVHTMNNTAFQTARRTAGLDRLRVHDLRHTFGQRLRDAGVSEEDRALLLGHAMTGMPQHYATATIPRLVEAAKIELASRVGADGRRRGRKDGGQYVHDQFQRRLFPKFGDLAVKELNRSAILTLLDSVKAEGKLTTANRLYADIKQMLDFALKRDLIERNPLDTIKKRDIGGKESARARVLSDDEVRKLVGALPIANMSQRSTTAIWLILATGCRVGEAMTAQWVHVDLDRKTWHLPVTKNEREHTIHLSAFAVRQLEALMAIRYEELERRREEDPKASPSPWVFPSADGTSHVNVKSFGKQLADRQRIAERRMKNRAKLTSSLVLPGGRWTAHDLRRTAATMMAQLGVSGDVIDECLNHMIESRVRRTYIRDRREAQQVGAFDLLGEHLDRLTSSAEGGPKS